MIHNLGPFTEQVTIAKHTSLVKTTIRHPSGLESIAEDENVYWSRCLAWRAMAVLMASKVECEVPVDAVRIDEL